MKIISKYKDFYDHIVQDNDADITYVRNIGLVYECYDKLFVKEGNLNPYILTSRGCTKYKYLSHLENGKLSFSNFIFGIYPYVYSQPILQICYQNANIVDSAFIILSKELVDGLINNDKETYNKLIKLAQNEYDKLSFYKNKVSFSKYTKLNDIKYYTWKIECKEIFYKINAPVFVKYDDILFNGLNNNVYASDVIKNLKEPNYVTNISFQKLQYNILKYWYNELNDLNTYINIENFLWSIKQEPISIPDNKTKILSHGFDLKTSFRNIK